jgi:hypothetical protein
MTRIGTPYRHPVSLQCLMNFHDFSWEPTENFDCENLLKSFWKEVGDHKKERVREGVEIFPGKGWIGTLLL